MHRIARIMLVEDNQADIDLTLDAFNEARLENEIKVCRGGQEALDYLLGARETPEGRAMSYDGGANSYLIKPVSFIDFLDVAQQVAEYWLALNVEPPRQSGPTAISPESAS